MVGLIAGRGLVPFSLMRKEPKNQDKTKLPPTNPTQGPPFCQPSAQALFSLLVVGSVSRFKW
ncbi:hypothetical protein C3K47_10925 [Solitalea longa]|uniref:Uncharacterized protein n=1 Tax=Solitalea longa TaxID=2079460 RepID=A0A2S5A0Z3_9SPHI|nr:hypothetical protein C3K47_10925 [Solitalea longa]